MTALPDRFPCWCRATYSWGGESKHDLGFVEGDLIECLNAGDGSWWMGRLRRNKQTGLFPSNFVQVLDPSFIPVSRGSSPSVSGPAVLSSPKKTKTFRKPFQSYAQVQPFASHELAPPLTPHHASRRGSAATSRRGSDRSPPSGGDPHITEQYDEYASDPYARSASADSEAPPPPPAHRYARSRPHSPSPIASPSGMTPSPLRDAMAGVISSLEDMRLPSDSIDNNPHIDPWSPEAFAELQTYRPRSRQSRAQARHTLAGTAFEASALQLPLQSFRDSDQSEQLPSDTSDHVSRSQSQIELPDRVSGPQNEAIHRQPSRRLRARKSAYELGRHMLDRTFSQRTSATSSSNGLSISSQSTDRTSQSLMSGYSAGKFSATSAGSLAKRRHSPHASDTLSHTSHQSHISHQSHSSHQSQDHVLRPRRSGFLRKLVDSAKAGAASTRSSIADGRVEPQRPPIKSLLPTTASIASGSTKLSDADWMQVRRDINRSNSLSHNERLERRDRCEMLGHSVSTPPEFLVDESTHDDPISYASVNLLLVDKSARFVSSLPPVTNSVSLAQGFLCRPYRSDVQRLRAIFTWVSEKIVWEEDFEGPVDTRRVIQLRRGSAKEVATLVHEMCAAVGLVSEIVPGLLKCPEDILDSRARPPPNHCWNAVMVDEAWRMMDCSLASPSNPQRPQHCTAPTQQAEFGYFLARPSEFCYSHVPVHSTQQHLSPPAPSETLMALPCASPPYFQHRLQMTDFDTSLLYIDNLELVHVKFSAPADVECAAEVRVKAYQRDADGDLFESGDQVAIRALVQAEWIAGSKQYTVKAHLPGDEGVGVLRVYAGKRGLMHSIRDVPHPLAFSLPIAHSGQNPPFEFFLRHPTPHALRHDLYVAQPQCRQLAFNNTFVFTVRQHPSSMPDPASRPASPFSRPGSAMSMSSEMSETQKPAKLAMQSPSGKIMRMVKKAEQRSDGSTWESIIKIGERGTWRGLVLADRSARWCVFGEWECP